MTDISEVGHSMENREVFRGGVGRSGAVREANHGGCGLDALKLGNEATNAFIIRIGEIGIIIDNSPVRRCGGWCHVAIAKDSSARVEVIS